MSQELPDKTPKDAKFTDMAVKLGLDTTKETDVSPGVTYEEIQFNPDDQRREHTDENVLSGFFMDLTIDTTDEKLSGRLVAGKSKAHSYVFHEVTADQNAVWSEGLDMNIDGSRYKGHPRFALDRINQKLELDMEMTRFPQASPVRLLELFLTAILNEPAIFRSMSKDQQGDLADFAAYSVKLKMVSTEPDNEHRKHPNVELSFSLGETLIDGVPNEAAIRQAISDAVVRHATGQ